MITGIIIGFIIAMLLFFAFGVGVKLGGESAKEKMELKLGDSLDKVLAKLKEQK